jgi:hypothetical protein
MNPHIMQHRSCLIELPLRSRVGGRYKLQKGKNLGYIDANSGLWMPGKDVITGEVPWFNNLILNQGLDLMATNNNYLTWCHVGTGTTAEVVGNTALQTFLAATQATQSGSATAQGSAPYYGSRTTVKRFDEGDAEGNVSEVGFGIQSTTGNLFTRALVKDGGGSPTIISVQSDEWLDVSYELRLYPDHLTVSETTVDGYALDILASQVTNVTYWGGPIGEDVGFSSLVAQRGWCHPSTAVLGAVTGIPTGSGLDFFDTGSVGGYSGGSYNRNITYNVGLSDGNVSGGIGAMQFFSTLGAYQILFDPVIAKDSSKVLDIVLNYAWTRATIP